MTTPTDYVLDDEPEDDHDWHDPPGEVTPPRRRRWLTPGSAALLAVAVGFVGFYAGVREEKTSATGAGSGSTRSSAGRSPGAGAATTGTASGVTAGTVTRVDGVTVYIKEPSGDTVQVKLLPSTDVSKSLSVSGHSIRPGDTVAIQGTQGSDGTIKSSSISDSGNTSTPTTTSQAGTSASSG
jgi:hypothetical protein